MRFKRIAGTALVIVVTLIVVVAAQNLAIDRFFRPLPRVVTDFSPAYLQRSLRSLADEGSTVVFLGDSVLWGYELAPGDTAVARLADRGISVANLAFKSGSPPNYYVLARLLHDQHVRPKVVVLEINQKTFNASDSAYGKLHPALASLAQPFLTPDDRRRLDVAPERAGFTSIADAVFGRFSLLYAMRSDVRETLYGDPDPAPPATLTPDAFEGDYDLAPLATENFGVYYLARTVAEFHAAGVPVVCFLTPTNHTLLHDYIDNRSYRANGAFLARVAAQAGARVIDLDRRFPAREFIDNDHLTAAGQAKLANILAAAIPLR